MQLVPFSRITNFHVTFQCMSCCSISRINLGVRKTEAREIVPPVCEPYGRWHTYIVALLRKCCGHLL